MTSGSFNYVSAEIESSLYRNGRMLLRRGLDGSDSGFEGVVLEEHKVPVANARAEACTLAQNGFELASAPGSAASVDFWSHRSVLDHYYPACEALLQVATGAALVRAFDHNVRAADRGVQGRPLAGGQAVQPPAKVVHGDYTLTSGPQRLRDLANPPTENDTYRDLLGSGETLLEAELVEGILGGGRRFALINVWQNIADEPVASDPLALCDAQTVHPEDLVVFELHYSDRIGENYWAKYADRHRWYTFPQMTNAEALLIKQWDSGGPLARSKGATPDGDEPQAPCTFSFHSSYRDPETPENAPRRTSIEVRCVVLYE